MDSNTTLSQEGIGDIFAKIGKWFKRTFSLTGTRIEKATIKRDETLELIRELGPQGNDYVTLLRGGIFTNQRTLDAITRTLLKKPVLTTEYTADVLKWYRQFCNAARARDYIATAPIMLDLYTGGKFYHELVRICRFFIDTGHLVPYLEVARLVRRINDLRQQQSVIRAGLEMENLRKLVKRLPHIDVNLYSHMAPWYEGISPLDKVNTPACMENLVLAGAYNECLIVFDHVHNSGVYDSIEEILDCWEVRRKPIEGDDLGNKALEVYYDHLDSEMRSLAGQCLGPIRDVYNAIQLLLDAGFNGYLLHRRLIEAHQDYVEALYAELKKVTLPQNTSLESHEFKDLPVNLVPME